jgi:hypothetical protein
MRNFETVINISIIQVEIKGAQIKELWLVGQLDYASVLLRRAILKRNLEVQLSRNCCDLEGQRESQGEIPETKIY